MHQPDVGRCGPRPVWPTLRAIAACAATALGLAACTSPLQPLLDLVLSSAIVEFHVVRGSTEPVSQTITVSNGGGGRLGPVACPESPATWLVCSVSSGNVVRLTALATDLADSPPAASVPLSAPGIAETTAVTVRLILQQPVLAVSSNHLAFSALEGSSTTTPGLRAVLVANTGAGVLASLGPLECEPAASAARVQCSVNQTSGELTVTVDPAGLAPGNYTYPVTVRAAHSTLQQNLVVVLNVSALPRIGLSQRTLHFQAIRGTTAPLSQTVTVTNTGDGELGTIGCPAAPAAWLGCAVSGNTLTLQVNPAGLTASPTPVVVNVTASGAANNPQTITVNFTVDQPLLSLSASTASFNAQEGSSTTTPSAVTVTASNSGAGSLGHLGPITCTPPAGSPVSCAVNPATGVLTLQVNPATAAPGVSFFPVQVGAAHSSINRTLTVSLSVTALPRLQVSASSVHLQAIRGTTDPVQRVLTIGNSGGGSLGDVSCPANPAAWLTCQINGSQLILVANPSGLTQSPDAVNVSVTAQNATNTAEVATTLTILQPVLTLNASLASFTATGPNTTAPASVAVQVSNTGAGTLAHLGNLSCAAAAPVSCGVDQASGVVTLGVNPMGLGSGTHAFVVSVSAPNMTNAAQTVAVLLTVP